ncbi:MAG: hypothetical protein CMI09_04460 [Oceanospirillaceae bacterium]|nr:hypothetical protein [Oceanospirillaceae bacterium]|tara:strand:- start:833 stop:1309 length:477 start_codon:yes stop_codon:yes gene_type:complete
MNVKPGVWFLLAALLAQSGCARLHSVHMNRITPVNDVASKPISVRLDASAINMQNLSQLAAHSNSKAGSVISVLAAAAILSTGDARGPVVYQSELTGKMDWVAQLMADCPSGRLANIRTITEGTDYFLIYKTHHGFDADCLLETASPDADSPTVQVKE